ncbi:MAG: hypothetical protein QOE75_2226 [Solirubrobacterales bacterium]|nr:hypothetical protein [Solirubrobacterales bacterium]
MVVVGALYAVLEFAADNAEELVESADTGSIEISQVVLANGRFDMRLADDGGFEQTDASTPQIDVTVRNRGSETALLTQARVAIEDSARLPVCEYNSGDVIPSSKDYAVALPILPTPKERLVVRPLHQEVGAGAVDRFRVLFKVDHPGQEEHIYALRVDLVTDQARDPVEVGRFVVGVPQPVTGNGRILPEGQFAPSAYEDQVLASTWCMRRNLAAAERLLGRPGKRSQFLSALLPFQYADWWEEFADQRPAGAAVEPLLHAPIAEGPVLAVFAAEQTGDEALVERTREKAAQLMLLTAEEALLSPYDTAAAGATIAARQSLALSPSPQARRVLTQSETRQAIASAASLAEEWSEGG